MPKNTSRASRLNEFLGLLCFALALMLLISLGTYNPADPVAFFKAAGLDAPASNLIGPVGAFLSELLVPQLFGLAALLVPLVLLCVSGCLSVVIDPMGRQRALAETQRSYTKLIRWGNFEKASELVDPTVREEFLACLPALKQIRITDFEIGELDFAEGGLDVASVTVNYQGYSLSSFVETPIREEQEWHRQGRSNVWLVRPQIQGIVSAFTDVKR